jgi:hypothetical protein
MGTNGNGDNNDDEAPNDPPTRNKVKQAILKLKGNRSPGPDSINAELIKIINLS